MDSVAVIGLGLIGGSIALDLAAAGARVTGYDTSAETLAAARDEGVLSRSLGADLNGAQDADIVVVAVPVQHMPTVFDQLAALPPGRVRLITDAGSTKRNVLAAAVGAGLGDIFVGSHPLAGHHSSGWRASRTGSFVGATVYLCTTAAARADAVMLAEALWRRLGARTEQIDAAAHDARLAFTSHLPQLVASALANVLHDAELTPDTLGPGGRDMTRLAGSAADLWTGIALDNAESLEASLARMREQLGYVQQAIRDGDAARLHAWLIAGSRWRAG